MWFDIILKNGCVIDGTGNPWFSSDIAIKDGKIRKIGELKTDKATKTIDVKGLIVSPGFIDIHNHSDTSLLVDPKMESKLRQGVTTEVNGNCGSSPAPVNEKTLAIKGLRMIPKEDVDWTSMEGYFKKLINLKISQNVVTLVGHGTIRLHVMGDAHRTATHNEIEAMKELVIEAMEDGAVGLSTGLAYSPGCYAHTDEIIELAKTVADYNGIYTSHLRDSASKVMNWMAEFGSNYNPVYEAIEIGRKSGVRAVQLSHLNSNAPYVRDNNLSEAIRSLIVESRAEGINVNADILPSDWGSIAKWPGRSVFPPSYFSEGNDNLLKKLSDPVERARIKSELQTKLPSEMGFENTTSRLLYLRGGMGDCVKVYPPFKKHLKNPGFEGKTLGEIAEMKGKDLWESLFDLLVEEGGNVCILNKVMDNRMSQLTWSMTMPSSDGGSIEKTGDEATSRVRPTAYGGFPEALDWVREKKLVTIEDMVRRMTSMPANIIGLRDRGLLKENFYADITVFDFETIQSRCTYEDDARPEYPYGIPYVIVNGELVLDNYQHTGAFPGKVLRHPF